jgi:hypothetical protein
MGCDLQKIFGAMARDPVALAHLPRKATSSDIRILDSGEGEASATKDGGGAVQCEAAAD